MKCLNIAKTTIPTKTEPVQIVITHANVQAIVVYAFTKYTISIVILAQDTAIIADFFRVTMYEKTF